MPEDVVSSGFCFGFWFLVSGSGTPAAGLNREF